MATNQTTKKKRSLLKTIGLTLTFVGLIVFIVGFFLQFFSIASKIGSMDFEEPKNYFVVIGTGFAIMFFGMILNMIDGVRKAKDLTSSVISNVTDTFKQARETHERMRQPKEIYCEYCGTLLHENERECPNCGANRTKK